jgi:hypothetical protein
LKEEFFICIQQVVSICNSSFNEHAPGDKFRAGQALRYTSNRQLKSDFLEKIIERIERQLMVASNVINDDL